MQIRALKAFSTGTFAMEQYEIRDVDDTLAASLIAQGLAAEVGGSGGGVLVLTESVSPYNSNYRNLSESFATINAALIEGKSVILKSGNYVQGTIVGTYEEGVTTYEPVVLRKAKFKMFGDDAATQEEEIDWQTQELEANLFRDDTTNEDWRYIGGEESTEAAAETAVKTALGVTP